MIILFHFYKLHNTKKMIRQMTKVHICQNFTKIEIEIIYKHGKINMQSGKISYAKYKDSRKMQNNKTVQKCKN